MKRHSHGLRERRPGRSALSLTLLAAACAHAGTRAPLGFTVELSACAAGLEGCAGGAAPLMQAQPLDRILVRASGGEEAVLSDGLGREIGRYPLRDVGAQKVAEVILGGELGSHTVRVEDHGGRVLGLAALRVDTSTGLEEEVGGGDLGELLGMLVGTMREVTITRFRGRDRHSFVPWLRDHTHVLKAMKYFYPELTSELELYRDTQRADGMIWDNHYEVGPARNHWDDRFQAGGFVHREEGLQLRRIPVEADVEYLYVEAIWHVWKATGDDAWLRSMIDSAKAALRYSLTDPLRWSARYRLVRRGYTIDTWDFQHEDDAARVGGDAMLVDLERSAFGIMHGDNTGMVASSRRLGEMLEALGQREEAKAFRETARQLEERLDALAWNGRFYTHHVPEDPSVPRDLGATDASEQLSLSNAYALNRGLPQAKRAAILRSYQQLRAELPEGSPGEWYSIYPIFERGFGGSPMHWHYVNGGVLTIVAGELSRGAFESGFEAYGVDILRRVTALARRHDRHLPTTFRGKRSAQRAARFTPLDLSGQVNLATTWEAAQRFGRRGRPLPVWGHKERNGLPDLPRGEQTLAGVRFDVLPDARAGGRVAIALRRPQLSGAERRDEGYLGQVSIPVGQTARSLTFLHAASDGNGQLGTVTLRYADGSSYTSPIRHEREVYNWWYPEEHAGALPIDKVAVIAWEGQNALASRVGLTAYALDNPAPERPIRSLELRVEATGATWYVLGITLSDQASSLVQSDLSAGIPDNWGAAAVASALIEGLAGLSDESTRFGHARVAPRWPAAAVSHVVATAKYPASQGYVRYRYDHDPLARTLRMTLTGSGDRFDLRVLLPDGAEARSLAVNGRPQPLSTETIEDSAYVIVRIDGRGVHQVEVGLSSLPTGSP